MRRLVPVGLVWVLLGCGGVLLGRPVVAQGYDIRMQRVLLRFVETSGFPVLGVGSWISGNSFNPQNSDFDMRLVAPQGGTQAQQLARWQQARGQLAQMIRQEFGQDAGNVLSRTNLYPPNQLMQGVENAEDALERFQKLKTAPNLAHHGPVTPGTPGCATEGVYGAGGQTYVQGYERKAGRLFYSNNGKAVTGLSELAHLGEEAPRYTAGGTANTAGQFAVKGLEELAAGRGDKVAKQLNRMLEALVKSRSMSRLPQDEAFRKSLEEMGKLLKNSPEKLAEVSDDVARLLTRGRAEAALLRGFENAGPIRRAYLRVMLDGVQAKSKLAELLHRVMKAAPDCASAENAINFLVFAIGTRATAQAAGGGDMMETLGTACEHLKWMKAFGPLFMMEITTAILTEAHDTGLDLAASSQEAWDLMAGIYTAEGRVMVDPDRRRHLTLADLVARYQYEREVAAIVMAHCLRASTRDLGEATGQADQGTAEALFARCWPVIRAAWLWERDSLVTEYLNLGSEVVHTPLLIYHKPTQPQPGERVVCEARSFDEKLGERLERMRQIVRLLYGKSSGLAVNYFWEPDGERTETSDWQRAFTFQERGKHTVKVRLEVAPFTKHTETEHRVMLRREVPALVEVVVGGEAKPDGVTPDDSARPAVHQAWEGNGRVTLRNTGSPRGTPDPERETAGADTYFAVPVSTRCQLLLHPAGASPPQLKPHPWDGLLPLRDTYQVPAGVPYRLQLIVTTTSPGRVSDDNPDSRTRGCRVDASLAPPRLVLNITHQVPGGETTHQEITGGAHKLEAAFQPNEHYIIRAFALFDYTATTTGPNETLTHSLKGVRHQIAEITVSGR